MLKSACAADTDQVLLLACRGPLPSCGMSSGQTPIQNWWASTRHEKRKTTCSRKTIKVSRDAARHPQPARAGQLTPRLPFSVPEARRKQTRLLLTRKWHRLARREWRHRRWPLLIAHQCPKHLTRAVVKAPAACPPASSRDLPALKVL